MVKVPKGYRSKDLEDRRKAPPVYAMDKKRAYDLSYMLEDQFAKMDTKARKNVGPRTVEVYKALKKRRKY